MKLEGLIEQIALGRPPNTKKTPYTTRRHL